MCMLVLYWQVQAPFWRFSGQKHTQCFIKFWLVLHNVFCMCSWNKWINKFTDKWQIDEWRQIQNIVGSRFKVRRWQWSCGSLFDELSTRSNAILFELTEPRLHLKPKHVASLSDLLQVSVFLFVQNQQKTLQLRQTERFPLQTNAPTHTEMQYIQRRWPVADPEFSNRGTGGAEGVET